MSYRSHFTTTIGCPEGSTGKTTVSEFVLMANLAVGVQPDLVVTIEGTNRFGSRLAKSEGGKRIAANMVEISPTPDRQKVKDEEKVFIKHYNPIWALLKKSRVALMDQGANVFPDFAAWWIDADVRSRCEREGIMVQTIVTCSPEAMPIKAALESAKVCADVILPAGGKVFVVFNERGKPKGFAAQENYREYRELVALCDSGVATRIDLPSCRSDFFRWASNEDVAVMGLLERLGDRDSDTPEAKRRFEELCRRVGIDPEDEISVDDEVNAFFDWLAVASEGFKQVVHPDLLTQVSKLGAKAAE